MDNKVVIITGGGKGIGYGVAEAFAEEGYNIVITGRTKDTLDEAKHKLEDKYKVKVLALVGDGSDEQAVREVVQTTIKEFGKINVLINNAQASKSGKMLVEHTDEDFLLAINSGLMAAFHYMRECFNYLKETQGSVINFASGAGLFGRVGQSSYAAAKEGIRGLSRVAATEWGAYNINVNVVCPLVMTSQLASWKEEYPEAYNKTIQGIPMGRFGDAKEDIGRVCVFLASKDAAYLSGETITLQGASGLRP